MCREGERWVAHKKHWASIWLAAIESRMYAHFISWYEEAALRLTYKLKIVSMCACACAGPVQKIPQIYNRKISTNAGWKMNLNYFSWNE